MTDVSPEMSLHDEVKAAFEAITVEAEPVEVPQEVVEEPDQEEASDRDEKGRFKAKEIAEETVEQPVEGDPEPVEERPSLDPYALPPQHASKVLKDKWGELTPDLREEYHTREKDFHRELTKQDGERNFGKQVKQVLAPYEEFIKSMGVEPTQAFDYLLKTDYALRTAPPQQRAQMLLKAAADYGIDLVSFAQNPAHLQQQQPIIPLELQQRISFLESQVNSVTSASRESDQAELVRELADFASRPENVYFDRVALTVATLLDSKIAPNLEKAYEMAVFADPETRALHLDAERQAQDRKRTAEKAAQAAAARQASPSVTGAPGNAVPASSAPSSASLEDDIRNAIRAAESRV